jgi:hypothetical protein
MRNKLILQAFVPALLLVVLIAVFPTSSISAQRCVDSRGNPIACPEEQKKRPTVVYPSFTPTLTLTPELTATKVPSSTPTLVSASSATPTEDPGTADLPGEPGGFLWPGIFLGGVGVLFIVWLVGGGGSSTFTAEAHGDLNVSEGPATMEMSGKVDGDDSVEGSAGMFTEKEDE